MEIAANDQEERLLATLDKSRSIFRNKFNYSVFYASSVSTIVILIAILVVCGYTVSIAGAIHGLISDGHQTLESVEAILPDIKKSLQILQTICKHENFTKHYGHICA